MVARENSRDGRMPTLRDLRRVLGDDLVPVAPSEPPAVAVTAVHVSELADPTRYLDGGELLLTTGLEFRGSPAWLRAYVRRLTEAEVAGLAFGLGPAHAALPTGLVRAARNAGLPLFTVPPPTPFLTISRRYWSLLAESGQRELAEMLSAHRALVAAALAGPPMSSVLRRLGLAIDGWAAHLAPDGRAREVWPARRRGSARELQSAVQRLDALGAPTALSLPLGEDDVVVQPLGGERLLGYLAVGHTRPLPRAAQQLTMTAVALLTLEESHARSMRLAARDTYRGLFALLSSGDLDAAQVVARSAGGELPERACICLLEGCLPELLVVALDADPTDRLIMDGPLDDVWFLLLRHGLQHEAWLRRLTAKAPTARAAVSAPVELEHFATSLRRVRSALSHARPGEVVDLGGDDAAAAPLDSPQLRAWAERRLAAVTGGSRTELIETLTAFLRSRSEQQAARELGVHRHTVRNRLARVEATLDVSLSDPDVAAELWLALRMASPSVGR